MCSIYIDSTLPLGVERSGFALTLFTRYNITVSGVGEKTMLFAHGYGCDQTMWRFVAPGFKTNTGWSCSITSAPGNPTRSAYSRQKYGTLSGYADDVLEIIEAVGGQPVIFVGHSVSAPYRSARLNPAAPGF